MSAGTVQIHRLGVEDAAELAPLYGDYLQEFGEAARAELELPFLASLLGQDWAVALGAKVDHRLAGFALGTLTYSSLLRARALHLADLYVIPSQRGRGCSRLLLRAVYRTCREMGLARIYGNVRADAGHFFQREGWRASDQLLLYRDV